MKFRISLSQEQIKWILSCPDVPPDLKNQLELALFKADKGMVKPAYEIKPREKRNLPIETQYKMALQFLERGDPVPSELQEAYSTYRYDNDLMSPEEMEEYEIKSGF